MPQAQIGASTHGDSGRDLRGEIDLSNTGSVRDARLDAVPETAVGRVVDLREATYLDSTRRRALTPARTAPARGRASATSRGARGQADHAGPHAHPTGHRPPAARDR
jgi:hypothetical protein